MNFFNCLPGNSGEKVVLPRKVLEPSAAVPVERMFSTAGDVLRPRRTCLSKQSFEHLVFLKGNLYLKGLFKVQMEEGWGRGRIEYYSFLSPSIVKCKSIAYLFQKWIFIRKLTGEAHKFFFVEQFSLVNLIHGAKCHGSLSLFFVNGTLEFCIVFEFGMYE